MLIPALVVYVVAVGGVTFFAVRSKRGSPALRIVLLILTSLAPFFCGGCLSLALINPLNDVQLRQFRRDLGQILHPPDSALLASRSDMGLLIGNGNHCDYFAGQIRQTHLSRQEVEDFYAGVTIPVAGTGGNELRYGSDATLEVQVLFVEDGSSIGPALPSYLPYRLEKASDWGVDVAQYPDGLLYVVYAFDVGYFPGSDLRCH